MGFLGKFDFTNGHLPPWLAPFIGLTRPLATTINALVIPAGAFMCGTMAAFDPERASAMASASGEFLRAIPDGLFWMVGGILGASFASASAEVIKAPAPPKGRKSPEQQAMDEISTPRKQGLDPENM